VVRSDIHRCTRTGKSGVGDAPAADGFASAQSATPISAHKKAVLLSEDGNTRLHAYENAELVRAVRFGVVTAGLGMMLLGVAGMAMRAVGVVGGLLVVAGFMMLGGFTVMLGRVLVVFGGLVVMLDGMLAHVSLPVGD